MVNKSFKVGKFYEINTHKEHKIPKYAKDNPNVESWRQHTIYKVTELTEGRVEAIIILTDSNCEEQKEYYTNFTYESYIAINSKEYEI
jgi:hypothetical protein